MVRSSNYFMINENNSITTQDDSINSYRLFDTDTKENGEDFIKNYFLQKRPIGWPTAILFRRRDIDKVGFFDIDMGSPADIDMWCRILCFNNFYYLDKVLAFNRQFPGNLSKKLARHPFAYRDNMCFYFKTIPYIENKIDGRTKQIIWMNIFRKIYQFYGNAEGEKRDVVLRDLQLVARNLNISNKMKFFLLLTKDFLQRRIAKMSSG